MLDVDSLSLTEAVRLQSALSASITKRFQRQLALVFSDIVGSTPYFARFGNEAGHSLQQRHFDLLQDGLSTRGGRIIDTAGDGAFICFPGAEAACLGMQDVLRRMSADNFARPREHQLTIRVGIHCGAVLADAQVVTGDAVNFCSRIAASSRPGEIRVSRQVFSELPSALRMHCRSLEPVELKGIENKVALMELLWWDPVRFPDLVRIENSGEQLQLPALDTISFGRIAEVDGVKANDVVLKLPEERLTNMVSRWHFELRRRPEGLILRSVSSQMTEVNGRLLSRGEEADVRDGTHVVLAKHISLKFAASRKSAADPMGTALID